MSIVIDHTEALRVLDEIVAEHPDDYTYSQRAHDITGEGGHACQYVLETPAGEPQPGCLIGVYLNRIGLTVHPDFNGYSLDGLMAVDPNKLDDPDAPPEVWEFDEDKVLVPGTGGELPVLTQAALAALVTAQQSQDVEATWPEAVAIGRRHAEAVATA